MRTLAQILKEEQEKYTVEIIIYNLFENPLALYDELEVESKIKETFNNYEEAIDFILNNALSYGIKGNMIEILINDDQVYYNRIDNKKTLDKDELSLHENLNEEVKIHDTLNPEIWDGEELKPEVKESIEKIVDKFVSNLSEDGIDLKVNDILLLGSNANYNYTDYSDLDIHILADEESDCEDHHLPLIFNIYKTLFNKKYDIDINGINVELYVEDANNTTHHANGVYSLKDGWVRKPIPEEIPEIDEIKIQLGTDEWVNKFDDLIESNPTSEEIEEAISELYEFRQEGLKDSGEFSEQNLIFKEIRNQGYLDKLKNIRDDIIGKELSLDN